MNGIILPKENFWYYYIHRNYYKYTDNAISKYIRILIKKSNKPHSILFKYIYKRFTQIFWILHAKIISAQSINPTTRLQLRSNCLDYINLRFLYYFISNEQICIKFVINLKVLVIMYNSKRPTKWVFEFEPIH